MIKQQVFKPLARLGLVLMLLAVSYPVLLGWGLWTIVKILWQAWRLKTGWRWYMQRARFDQILIEEGITSKDFRDELWITKVDHLDAANAEDKLRKTCRSFLGVPRLKRRMDKAYGE